MARARRDETIELGETSPGLCPARGCQSKSWLRFENFWENLLEPACRSARAGLVMPHFGHAPPRDIRLSRNVTGSQGLYQGNKFDALVKQKFAHRPSVL